MLRSDIRQLCVRRLFPLVVSVALVLSSEVAPAQGIQSSPNATTFREYLAHSSDTDAPTITLRKKFFGSQKFVYGGNEPSNVFNFFGISYRKEFQGVLSVHPAALREAKRAVPYRAAGMIGLLTLVGFTAKIFINTVNQAKDVSSGTLPEDDAVSSGDLAGILIAGGVGIFSGVMSKRHLKNGVRIFNEKQKQMSTRKR